MVAFAVISDFYGVFLRFFKLPPAWRRRARRVPAVGELFAPEFASKPSELTSRAAAVSLSQRERD
jgi:hypothetical protein